MADSNVDRLNGYRTEIDFALPMGDGPLLRESRARLASLDLTADETAELQLLDQIVLEEITQREAVQAYLLEDALQMPLTHWWWHLGKLRSKTYPASQLPPGLRAVYLENRQAA